MNKNKQTSFTLIELLVVIVIIGILAGVIMISTSSSIDKASVAKLKVFEESVSNNLAVNMVSRWKLDGNTNDSWGNSNGTNNGVTFLNESLCVSGQCGSFNGTSYINCGNSGLNFGLSDFTINAWIKTSSATPVLTIFTKGSTNAAYNQGRYNLRILNRYLEFSISNNELGSPGDGIIDVTIPLNDGVWHNVLGTRASNIIKIYIDGKYINQKNTITTLNVNNDLQANIGAMWSTTDSSFQYFFDDLIDDVRTYNAALSSSQIRQNYIAGLNSLLGKGLISREEYNLKIENLSDK